MASPTWWTWVWVDSSSWWWTGRPGMLWFMGSQRVGHDWATERTELNLPWFTDLTFQVPMQYCSLQHRTLFPSPVTSTTGHLFLLWCCLFILSGLISPFFSSSILGTYWSGEFIFQCPICLPFHTVHGVLKARTLKWFAIPFSSRPCFVRTLHHDSTVLRGATQHGHSFTELDKAVVYVISLISFQWLWFSFCLPSDGWGKETCGSFLTGGTRFNSVTQLCLTLRPHTLQHNRVPCLSLTHRAWSNLCP